jgi:uncharacterized protein YukE
MQGSILTNKETIMATITVSPDILREKARLIREVLEESKTAHQQLWSQITMQVCLLPRDLRVSHTYANNPWNKAVEEFYENYLQLALVMEAAADAYEYEDKNIQISFTPSDNPCTSC